MADYVLWTTLCTVLFVLCIVWRILHPFKCACGYRTWFAHAMFRHLATKHAYEK